MARITETLVWSDMDIGIYGDLVREMLICDRRSKGNSCLQLHSLKALLIWFWCST